MKILFWEYKTALERRHEFTIRKLQEELDEFENKERKPSQMCEGCEHLIVSDYGEHISYLGQPCKCVGFLCKLNRNCADYKDAPL